MTENKLAELMSVIGFRKISTKEEINKLFDLSKLDADGTPAIITPKKTVVVFDNSDFNSTYVIDIVNEYFTGKNYPENVDLKNIDFVYVDDPEIRKSLFNPGCTVTDVMTLETEILRAGIMVINPVKNHIVTFMENELNTVDQIVIFGGLNWLWSEVADIKVLGRA